MANVDIVVVKTPKGFLVRPAYALVERGDTIRWYNLTGKLPGNPAAGEEISVNVPCGQLGAVNAWEMGGFTAVVPTDAPYGFHAYTVYSARAKDFCKGESTPGVIIKG